MQQDLVVAIKLKGIKPCVTRQVQVSSNLGLDRFHQLMQVVMGWENTAPHLWRGWDNDFGDPRQFVPPGPQDERKASVADLFTTVGEVATYQSCFIEVRPSFSFLKRRIASGKWMKR